MTAKEIEATVLDVLSQIAPEADLTQVRPDVAFRDQLDIDSMDFLNFVIALHERLHLDIPETDYPQVVTLSGCIAYLAARAL